MGYRIAYDSIGSARFSTRRKKHVSRWLILTLLVSAIVCLLGSPLSSFLIPGDDAVTGAALSQMIMDIRSGEDLIDAVTVFCKEVISHADISG